jgi:hypothetical protein
MTQQKKAIVIIHPGDLRHAEDPRGARPEYSEYMRNLNNLFQSFMLGRVEWPLFVVGREEYNSPYLDHLILPSNTRVLYWSKGYSCVGGWRRLVEQHNKPFDWDRLTGIDLILLAGEQAFDTYGCVVGIAEEMLAKGLNVRGVQRNIYPLTAERFVTSDEKEARLKDMLYHQAVTVESLSTK